MNNLFQSRLSLTFYVGIDDDGDAMFQTRHFRNVKPSASDEALFETAVALSSLTMHDLDKVERNNTYELNA